MNDRLETYKLGPELGVGVSARVVEAEAPDGKKYAIKIYDLSNQMKANKQLQLFYDDQLVMSAC